MQILVIPVGIYDIWRRRRPMLYRELQIARTDQLHKGRKFGGGKSAWLND